MGVTWNVNRTCNANSTINLALTQRDPDCHRNLSGSFVAHVPPFHQILYIRLSSFCTCVLTTCQGCTRQRCGWDSNPRSVDCHCTTESHLLEVTNRIISNHCLSSYSRCCLFPGCTGRGIDHFALTCRRWRSTYCGSSSSAIACVSTTSAHRHHFHQECKQNLTFVLYALSYCR